MAAASVAALALVFASASAAAATPELEFVSPVAYPLAFTAEGGEITAALTDFDTVVHCAGSHGEGQVTGPQTTVSSYVFTECETREGTAGGLKCESAGASEKEIRAGPIEADLAYIDQAKHEVAMLLNPAGGEYMSFKCGGESVVARGPFLSPVGPVNQSTSVFSASLTRLGALQIPNEYEGLAGERLPAIPTGQRNGQPAVTTGVELSFTIHPSVPLEIRAVSAAEVEARQRDEEAAAKRRQEEEAARAAAEKRRQEEEAAAVRKRQEEEAARPLTRAQRLAKALERCRKFRSTHRRARCEARAKRKYSAHRGHRPPASQASR